MVRWSEFASAMEDFARSASSFLPIGVTNGDFSVMVAARVACHGEIITKILNCKKWNNYLMSTLRETVTGYCTSHSVCLLNTVSKEHKHTLLLTTASRQPKIAPKMSIFPIFTLTGSAARCCPKGVSIGWANSQAPIFRSRFIALLITWSWGGSNALERKSSGEPRSHFC